MEQYVMALDQGTTSSRCILFNHAGDICGMAQREFEQIYPHPGWVEQNPREIWSSQYSVMVQVMAENGIDAKQIKGIGITNQRETTIIWNRYTGEPVYNAIVWQCRRTAEMIDALKEEGFDRVIREKTGLIADAYFSASKIAWILDHVEGAREQAEKGDLLFGTVDTWLIWNLTGGLVHVTDYTNASRTMLFDIHKLCWDEEILAKFRIPRAMLPEVKPSSCIYGYTDEKVLVGNVPIAGAAGDQQAALFGQGCYQPGDVKNTYGTGGFMLVNTGEQPVFSGNGLITTIAWGIGDKVDYALEGSVFVSGATIQWLRDELRILDDAASSEKMARMVQDTAGAYIVPAFTGLGAPYWDPYARGAILGLTRGVNRNHIVRAALESMAYQTYDLMKAMSEDMGAGVSTFKVDGGACANDFLLEFQAGILDMPVYRPRCIETTSLGAAYLAGLATGYWKSKEDILSNWSLDCRFEPDMDNERRTELLEGWHKAVGRTFGWAGKK